MPLGLSVQWERSHGWRRSTEYAFSFSFERLDFFFPQPDWRWLAEKANVYMIEFCLCPCLVVFSFGKKEECWTTALLATKGVLHPLPSLSVIHRYCTHTQTHTYHTHTTHTHTHHTHTHIHTKTLPLSRLLLRRGGGTPRGGAGCADPRCG